LPVTAHYLFRDLDGTFPNHPADPLNPENQKDLKAAVLEHGADVGLAFDGDADRVFLIDEHAEDVSGSLLTAIVAVSMLRAEPGAKIVYNLICSWVVPETIRASGGEPVRTRVGHSFIKQVMADTGAIFGGEHSGHYYFRENYRADSGLIAGVVALGELSASPRSTPTGDWTASTDSRSSTRIGGATCGRPTPSRCCASTWRPAPRNCSTTAPQRCSR
jgi:phosphomannomutase